MSLQQDFTASDGWFRTEDKIFEWTVTDDRDVVQNISGWNIQIKISTAKGGSPVLTKSAVLSNPTLGVVQVTITSSESTNTLPTSTGNFFYRLSRTDAGARAELAYGTMVLQDIWTT